MADDFDVQSFPDEFTVVRVGDEFQVEQFPDEFIIYENSDDWALYLPAEAEYTLEFVTVGMNDAAIAVAAKNAALAAEASIVAMIATMAGGLTGQILIKQSNADYDFGWMNPTGMLTAIYDPNNHMADAFARANHTGTQSADTLTDGVTNKAFLATERTKLAGIATGATANQTDAFLLARANHTGTQSADTLTDGVTNKAFLATERTKLAGIATGATANQTDAFLLARANHTGTQLAATISDFSTAADLRIPAATHAAASKATPVDADEFPLVDSAAAFALKKWTWADIKAAIWAAFGALIIAGTAKATPVDADAVAIADSAAGNATKQLTFANLKAFVRTYILGQANSWTAMNSFQGGLNNIGSANNATNIIEFGYTGGANQLTIIDFHTSATAVDYDSRLMASGNAGTVGGGIITWVCNGGFNISATTGGFNVTSGDINAGSAAGRFKANGVNIPFHKQFESAQQTITSAGSLTIAHGLGVQPKLVMACLQCTTAELGYSIGDEVELSPSVQMLSPDATNINVRYSSLANAYSIIHKTTGVNTGITNGNWRLVVKAWA